MHMNSAFGPLNYVHSVFCHDFHFIRWDFALGFFRCYEIMLSVPLWCGIPQLYNKKHRRIWPPSFIQFTELKQFTLLVVFQTLRLITRKMKFHNKVNSFNPERVASLYFQLKNLFWVKCNLCAHWNRWLSWIPRIFIVQISQHSLTRISANFETTPWLLMIP